MSRIRNILFAATIFWSLSQTENLQAQDFAVKTNTLYLATLTTNIGIEFAINHKTTLELSGAYKPWTVRKNTNIRLWLIQPEGRYWLCETFEGHFFGTHLHGAQYYARHKGKILRWLSNRRGGDLRTVTLGF